MPTTPAARRAAANLQTGFGAPGVTPGLDTPVFRQAAGWGFVGIPVGQAAAVVADEVVRFVYRRRMQRLRARKRS